jgi:hypothetical protein
MYIPCISNAVDIRGISKDIPCISTDDIRCISLYIHGISVDVCAWYIRGISVYIPSFLFLDFFAGPSCWSHSMRTRVLVIKIGLFHAPPWQLCLGIRRPTKGSLLLSPRRGRRWRLALRGAAGRLRGGRLGGLVLIWILADVRCRTSDVRHRIIPMLHTMSYVMHVRHRTPTMS